MELTKIIGDITKVAADLKTGRPIKDCITDIINVVGDLLGLL